MSNSDLLAQGPVLTLQAGAAQYGQRSNVIRALKDVSITINAGERVALIGANGCGKSTLLRVLAGLQAPFAGSLHCATSRRAMVFQRPFLLRLSVWRNVALGPWLGGVPWSQARQRAMAALKQLDLADLTNRKAHTLSGGQQQRVAMARAWACKPDLMVLDEPSANLDPHAKRDVEALVQALAQSDPAMTLVFASHNLGQVKRLATRVLYLEDGRLQADLPVDLFFSGELLEKNYPNAFRFVRGDPIQLGTAAASVFKAESRV